MRTALIPTSILLLVAGGARVAGMLLPPTRPGSTARSPASYPLSIFDPSRVSRNDHADLKARAEDVR